MTYVYLLLSLLLVSPSARDDAQYFTRTGHVFVKSSNKVMTIKANNYQVNSVLDGASGNTTFTGLIKSFEFDLGVADRLFSGKRVSVVEQPKILFEGTVSNIKEINFKAPGEYPAKIEGTLYIWGYKRKTSARGTVSVLADGSVRAKSSFTMRIEEESMNKINELMRRHLPSIVDVNTDDLGVSRDIEVEVNMAYNKR